MFYFEVDLGFFTLTSLSVLCVYTYVHPNAPSCKIGSCVVLLGQQSPRFLI